MRCIFNAAFFNQIISNVAKVGILLIIFNEDAIPLECSM